MSTEIAFLCRAVVGMNVQRIVGAGLHAGPEADTCFTVGVDYAVFAPKQGGHWAICHTRSVVAVVTTQDGKESPNIREGSLLYIFYPCSVRADGYIVFRLAGERAGVTTDATALVNDEGVAHMCSGRRVVMV